MKQYSFIIALITLCISAFPAMPQESKDSKPDWPVLKGPYLSQKPPGMAPEIFAPGIISTAHYEHGITFSPNGEEIYFTRRITVDEGNRIFHMKVKDGAWTEPSLAPFAYACRESSPNFSPDGRRIFYNSRRLYRKMSIPRIR